MKYLILFLLLSTNIYAENPDEINSIKQDLQNYENLGGKHIKPKEITTSKLNLLNNSSILTDKYFYLDGGSDTYIYSDINGRIYLFSNNQIMMGLYQDEMKNYSFGSIVPNAGNTLDLGTASLYWANIHYHSLVSHSLKEPADKTGKYIDKISAISIEDKSTYPTDVYIKAKNKYESDGTDVNQLIVYLINTIKELDSRIKILEKK